MHFVEIVDHQIYVVVAHVQLFMGACNFNVFEGVPSLKPVDA